MDRHTHVEESVGDGAAVLEVGVGVGAGIDGSDKGLAVGVGEGASLTNAPGPRAGQCTPFVLKL